MNLFNLLELSGAQEIPKIAYRPFKVTDHAIYFEKIHALKDQEWTDGIFEYSRFTAEMVRLDSGPWVESPLTYDVEVPYAYEDIVALQKMNCIYYSVTSGTEKQEVTEFFCLDLENSTQRSVFSFSFNKEQVIYRGMELLNDDYLLFRITDAEREDSDFMDQLFLIDIKEKKHYEIQDSIFKMTFGQKILIPRSKPLLLVEEFYISEEEQYDLITSRDLELAMEIPEDFHEDNVHRNAFHFIELDTFIQEIKAESKKLSYDTYDQVFLDGSLRLAGETSQEIFYRKHMYDFVLREKNDFLSRKMIGNEQLWAIHEDTLKSRMICTMKYPAQLFNGNGYIYKIGDTEENIEIKNLLTGEVLYLFIKNPEVYKEETFYGCCGEILMIKVKYPNRPDYHQIRLISIGASQEEVIVNDAFEIGGVIFVL